MTLYILAADGSYETAIIGAATGQSFPVWAPDGSRVFFISASLTRNPDLLSIAVRDGRATGAPSVVKSGIGWAPLVGVTRAGVCTTSCSSTTTRGRFSRMLGAADQLVCRGHLEADPAPRRGRPTAGALPQ